MPQDWTNFSVSSVQGKIDDLRIYNSAIDSLSVASLASAGNITGAGKGRDAGENRRSGPNISIFSRKARVSFSVAGASAYVEAALFDLHGRKTVQLFKGSCTKGTHGMAIVMPRLSNGVYFAQLKIEGSAIVRSKITIRE